MARRGRKYGRGALGGAAVIAATIGGLHFFQATARPSMEPSIIGSRSADCTTTASLTTCTATGPSITSAAVTGSAGSARFRDGSYAANGAYLTPGGAEAIGVRLTVTAGQITSAQVRVQATSPTARQFQRQFATRYAAQVVSRPLAELAITRVAGASLTSLGFDNALAQIRSQARAQD